MDSGEALNLIEEMQVGLGKIVLMPGRSAASYGTDPRADPVSTPLRISTLGLYFSIPGRHRYASELGRKQLDRLGQRRDMAYESHRAVSHLAQSLGGAHRQRQQSEESAQTTLHLDGRGGRVRDSGDAQGKWRIGRGECR
jgi:hypothetical protein